MIRPSLSVVLYQGCEMLLAEQSGRNRGLSIIVRRSQVVSGAWRVFKKSALDVVQIT